MFQGTLSGYGSSNRNEGDSHPHRYRLGNAMRTPLKLLTVGLVLVTAAVAGCSSTAGSSGAVQDDAGTTAPSAASSAASTGPAPSPDPVAPTVEPTEAAASPVASPTDSPSPSVTPQSPALLGQTIPPTTANNDVCDPNLAYACGSIGPGTGTVFYASATPFACGAGLTSSCNFLEAAQNGWNGPLVTCMEGCITSTGTGFPLTSDWGIASNGKTTQPGFGSPYCNGSGRWVLIPDTFATSVGSGYSNTTAMITMCNAGSAGLGSAGNLARSYGGGGMTNWSLPSLDELNALLYYAVMDNRGAIGGFAQYIYWSSSGVQTGSSADSNAWYENFGPINKGEQTQAQQVKNINFGVRPVRAF